MRIFIASDKPIELEYIEYDDINSDLEVWKDSQGKLYYYDEKFQEWFTEGEGR